MENKHMDLKPEDLEKLAGGATEGPEVFCPQCGSTALMKITNSNGNIEGYFCGHCNFKYRIKAGGGYEEDPDMI